MSVIRKTIPAHTSEPIFPLTVEQYHNMIERGTLTDEDPVELIDGVLIYKMPKNPPHTTAVLLSVEAIRILLPPGWSVRSQDAITLSNSEPEPDVVVCRGTVRDYAKRHPGPADIALVVAVADTTLSRDRGVNLEVYARSGLVEYWLLGISSGQLEVFSDPDTSTGQYRKTQVFSASQSVPLAILGQLCGHISVASILP
jgi:Uma2 family endonuclease